MKSFLFHTLNNLIIDHYRRKRSQSLDALLERGFDPGCDDTERLVDTLDGQTAQQMIRALPMLYQRVMHLRHTDDQSISEIALETGLSRSAVGVRLHRGLALLRIRATH